MDADFQGPHLIYTAMGGIGCFSVIPYRIETFEWDGIVEPIFLDDQIDNIENMTNVPCLKFL